jgi:hypothetical protein
MGGSSLERKMTDGDEAVTAAADAAAIEEQLSEGEAICIVVFDGDSGIRCTPLGQGLWMSEN